MDLIRSQVDRLVQRLKHDPEYRIDPAIPTRSLLAILFSRGMSLLRGLTWYPRLGSVEGPFFVGHRVRIRHPYLVRVGRSVTLDDDVYIDALSRNGVRLGDNVSIGRFTIIETTGILTNLGTGFEIGANSNLGDYNFVGASGGVTIGENVLIGQKVSFHSENHNFSRTDVPIKAQGTTRAGIVVEDDCWLGAGVIILSGVHIGHGSVVAAGSVVTKDVPPYSVVAGVPARIVKRRDEG